MSTLTTHGKVGVAYSSSITATGTAPFSVAVTAGSLPPGLAFSGLTLAGTPTDAGSFSFTAEVSNSCGAAANVYYITIAYPEIVYYGRSLDDMLDETGIAALTRQNLGTTEGAYEYAEGSGYLYYATTQLPASIKAYGLDVAMAGSDEGYVEGSNPMAYREVIIDSTIFYVFRTYNMLAGSLTVDVTI